MKLINIAICDDNKPICSQIESILLKYTNKNCIKTNIDVFYTGEMLLNYMNKGNKFDLIYLDIELGKMNGVEVGKKLRKVMKDYTTEIVYISGKDEYDRQLFDVQPLHFIPKPINPNIVIEDFKLALDRSQKIRGFFKYHKGNETFKICVDDIIYFESFNREIKIVTTAEQNYFYGNLEDVFLRISKFQFLRIHRSYLINYNHATILKYDEVIMSNGAVLPISRSRRHEIRDMQMDEE